MIQATGSMADRHVLYGPITRHIKDTAKPVANDPDCVKTRFML